MHTNIYSQGLTYIQPKSYPFLQLHLICFKIRSISIFPHSLVRPYHQLIHLLPFLLSLFGCWSVTTAEYDASTGRCHLQSLFLTPSTIPILLLLAAQPLTQHFWAEKGKEWAIMIVGVGGGGGGGTWLEGEGGGSHKKVGFIY